MHEDQGVHFGIDFLQQRIHEDFLLEDLLEFQRGDLEQFESLLELRRHDQTLLHPLPQDVFHLHSCLPLNWLVRRSPGGKSPPDRYGAPARS